MIEAVIMVWILLLSVLLPQMPVSGAENYQTTAEGQGYHITFAVPNRWEGGGTGAVTIQNTGAEAINGWMLTFRWEGDITACWNGAVEKKEGDAYTIRHDSWNSSIPAGQSVSFGFSAGLTGATPLPEDFALLTGVREASEEGYQAVYRVSSDWGTGFEGTITVTNTSDQPYEYWVLEFDFEREITGLWEGELLSHEENHYVVGNKGYNAVIPVGGSITFGFNGTGGEPDSEPHGYLLTDNTRYESAKEEDDLMAYLRSLGYDSIAEADCDLLAIGYHEGDDVNKVTGNLALPSVGTYGSVITWTSSHLEVIGTDGVVSCPEIATAVTLTAAADDGTVVCSREFSLQVAGKEGTGVEITDVEVTTPEDLSALNGGAFPTIYYSEEKQAAYYIEGCYTAMKVRSPADAVASLQTIDWLLGLGDEDDYVPLKTLEYEWGTVYRLGQYYKGVPLYGNEIIISTDRTGIVTSLNSTHRPGLDMDTSPAISGETASEKAILHCGGGKIAGSELYICRHQDSYRLTWVVQAEDVGTEEYPAGAVVLVDARSGEILSALSTLRGATAPASLSGIPHKNSAAAADADTDGKITVNAVYDDKKEIYYFRDPDRNITIRNGRREKPFFGKSEIVDASGGFEKDSIGQNALTALYHMEKIYDFYLRQWNYRSFDNKGSEVNLYIDFPHGTSWDLWNQEISVGKLSDAKAEVYTDAAGLDIIAHEFTHGVFQNLSGGMMDHCSMYYLSPTMEAYSDILGCLIESLCSRDPDDKGDGKWLLAEDVVEDGLRSLIVPGSRTNSKNGRAYPSYIGEDGRWINQDKIYDENYKDYEHQNSTPISHAAYLMSGAVGDDLELATLWFESISLLQKVPYYDTPGYQNSPDFTAISRAVKLTAKARNYSESQLTAIEDAFYQVGIDLLAPETEKFDNDALWVPLPNRVMKEIGAHVFISKTEEKGTVYAWVSDKPFWLEYGKIIVAGPKGTGQFDTVRISNTSIKLFVLDTFGTTWIPYQEYPEQDGKTWYSQYILYTRASEWDDLLLYTEEIVRTNKEKAAMKNLKSKNGGTSKLYGNRKIMFF